MSEDSNSSQNSAHSSQYESQEGEEIEIIQQEDMGEDNEEDPEGEDEEEDAVELVDPEVNLQNVHQEAIYCCDLTDQYFATGGGDKALFVVIEGLKVTEIKDQSDSVINVKFWPKRKDVEVKYLATASLDGTVRIWDINELVTNQKSPKPKNILENSPDIKWHPKGPIIIVGGADTNSWLWNAENGQVINIFQGHTGPITCGHFSPSGRYYFSGSEDGSLKI